ncbi:DUF1516 family protein [Levilactobacillus bambusae]|uniref:DUF1516 domain-containing protein n=1 Tax=Levilactobacillus bambusae TaxID=2024736 RepID=A0A2V1N6G5_9LACO|nr:DUF1516 family protein [Levilactobacillus bambusae]PWG01060.1 hypothetical protein DCM90_02485 [Levilactobacillus bambusae]
MWLLINLCAWPLLALFVLLGLHAREEKHTQQWLITVRVIDFILLVSCIILTHRTFGHHPVLVSANLLATITTLLLIEMSFNKKETWRFHLLTYNLLAIIGVCSFGISSYLFTIFN